jgi:dienelactone hydrolase
VADAFRRRLAKEDAEKLTVPFICLFSKEDGTPELTREYHKALEMKKKENIVETYGSMRHGWMGAGADFDDKDVVKEFERG